MHYPRPASTIGCAVIALASLTGAPALDAQARFATQSSPLSRSATSLLTALSNARTVRWASAGEVLHCSPAPLTERPGVQMEFARPRVVPLEEAFADAQSVKRAIAYRARPVALENR